MQDNAKHFIKLWLEKCNKYCKKSSLKWLICDAFGCVWGVGLRFGIVVTLKEMFGVNKIDEFIRSCNLNG